MSADTNRSLEEIFLSTFHEKMSFNKFLDLDVAREFHTIRLKRRKIYVPSHELKMAHKFINKSILEYADYNKKVVYSYRKGISVRDAVEQHSNNKFFFQTDIKNFYGNIKQADVDRALKYQLDNVPAYDVERYLDKILELVVFDNHIPTGFSTSPILSNICLQYFDNKLQEYCEDNELIYTRYSDDIIISSYQEEPLLDIGRVVSEFLSDYVNSFLTINTSKTSLHRKGHDFRLLGFTILPNGIVTIPSKEKKEIELLIYFYLTNKIKLEEYFKKSLTQEEQESLDKPLIDGALARISAKLIAFNAMDKRYMLKLRKKYGNAVVDMFLRKSVK